MTKVGKRWERQALAAFERSFERGFVARFNDSFSYRGQKNFGAKSPPDFIVIGANHSFLVECKAHCILNSEGKKLRFMYSKVKPHQIEHLLHFDGISPGHHGVVLLLIYDQSKKKRAVKQRAFIITIRDFLRSESNNSFSSMNIDDIENIGLELERVKNVGWLIPDEDILESLT